MAAAPITWRSLNAPNFGAGLNAAGRAGQDLGNAISQFGGNIKQGAEDVRTQETDEFITTLNSLNTDEERNDLIQTSSQAFLDMGKVNDARTDAQNQDFKVNAESRAAEESISKLKNEFVNRRSLEDQTNRLNELQANNVNKGRLEVDRLTNEIKYGAIEESRTAAQFKLDQVKRQLGIDQTEQSIRFDAANQGIDLERKVLDNNFKEEVLDNVIEEANNKREDRERDAPNKNLIASETHVKNLKAKENRIVKKDQLSKLSHTPVDSKNLGNTIKDINEALILNTRAGRSNAHLQPALNRAIVEVDKQIDSTLGDRVSSIVKTLGITLEPTGKIPADGYTATMYRELLENVTNDYQETFTGITRNAARELASKSIDRNNVLRTNFKNTGAIVAHNSSLVEAYRNAQLEQYGMNAKARARLDRHLVSDTAATIKANLGLGTSEEDIEKTAELVGGIQNIATTLRTAVGYKNLGKIEKEIFNLGIHDLLANTSWDDGFDFGTGLNDDFTLPVIERGTSFTNLNKIQLLQAMQDVYSGDLPASVTKAMEKSKAKLEAAPERVKKTSKTEKSIFPEEGNLLDDIGAAFKTTITDPIKKELSIPNTANTKPNLNRAIDLSIATFGEDETSSLRKDMTEKEFISHIQDFIKRNSP